MKEALVTGKTRELLRGGTTFALLAGVALASAGCARDSDGIENASAEEAVAYALDDAVGQCLDGTPYDLDTAELVRSSGDGYLANDILSVVPSDKDASVINFRITTAMGEPIGAYTEDATTLEALRSFDCDLSKLSDN